jgi:DNA-binding response OmpR family regulator/tetratricopeptide (TPR) repeat protein
MKVLVGESNYAEFEVLNDYLTGKGFTVHWVKNGPDAVTAFPHVQPRLLILDALLPGLTGLKVCQRIRKLTGGEQARTVLLSKVYRQFREQYESCKTIGVDAYSEKPVNVAELDRILADLLGEVAPTPAPAAAPAVEMTEPARPGETRRTLRTTGTLADTPFPRLLFYLYKYKRTGALRVAHEQISKVIYLREGNPVFVTSNLSNESLGRFLVQRGVITDDQYNTSLERMIATGAQQGAVLLEMGALTSHQLYEALQGQIREKILRVFAWDEGEYEFRPGAFTAGGNVQLDLPALKLILEGVKRFYTLSRLERYFNEYKNQVLRKRRTSLIEKGLLTLAPHDAKLFRLIDGKRTLGKIVAQSHLSLSETFQLLYFLLLTEVARFVGDPGFAQRSVQEQEAFVASRKQREEEFRLGPDERAGLAEDRLRQFRRAVARGYEMLNQRNFYELLEVPNHATADEVRAAYHRLAKVYRPFDLYSEADPDLRRKCDEVFAVLTEAYETLTNAPARRAYDDVLFGKPAPKETTREPELVVEGEPLPAEAPPPAAPGPDLGADADFFGDTSEPAAADVDTPDIEWEPGDELAAEAVDDTAHVLEDFVADTEERQKLSEAGAVTSNMANLVKSELAFQQGENALHQRDYAAAVRHFAEAVQLNPTEAEYHGYLGWATFLADPNDAGTVARGRDLLEKAVSINPVQDSAYTFLGMIHLHLGLREQARRNFELALQYNPENARAKQELGKLEAR